jgi:hypothetical protein
MRAAGDGATTRTGMKRVASDFPPPLGRGRPVALASRLAQPINVPACTPCDFAYSCAVSPLARHPATSACHSAALRRARRLARCNSTAFAMRSSYAAARYPHPARLQGAYPAPSKTAKPRPTTPTPIRMTSTISPTPKKCEPAQTRIVAVTSAIVEGWSSPSTTWRASDGRWGRDRLIASAIFSAAESLETSASVIRPPRCNLGQAASYH